MPSFVLTMIRVAHTLIFTSSSILSFLKRPKPLIGTDPLKRLPNDESESEFSGLSSSSDDTINVEDMPDVPVGKYGQ